MNLALEHRPTGHRRGDGNFDIVDVTIQRRILAGWSVPWP
jgi:hypothetical protein